MERISYRLSMAFILLLCFTYFCDSPVCMLRSPDFARIPHNFSEDNLLSVPIETTIRSPERPESAPSCMESFQRDEESISEKRERMLRLYHKDPIATQLESVVNPQFLFVTRKNIVHFTEIIVDTPINDPKSLLLVRSCFNNQLWREYSSLIDIAKKRSSINIAGRQGRKNNQHMKAFGKRLELRLNTQKKSVAAHLIYVETYIKFSYESEAAIPLPILFLHSLLSTMAQQVIPYKNVGDKIWMEFSKKNKSVE